MGYEGRTGSGREGADLQRESTPAVRADRWFPPATMVLAVAAGGAVGAVLRHAFVLAFPYEGGAFPLVTFWENVVGAFLMGVVLITLLKAPERGGRWRGFLATGVLGSFTTFSNVSLQIVHLAGGGHLWIAMLYTTLSLVAGLAAALAGIGLGTRLMRAR